MKLNIKEFPYTELTNSSRTTFTQCRQKFYWAYIARLVPNYDNKALMIGRLFHNGLEMIYKTLSFDFDEHKLIVETEVDKSVETCTSTEAADDLWKQSALILALLEGYAKFYLSRDKKTWKIIAPETTFSFPLKNGWTNNGMRDLLITRNGKLGLVEHKTTTQLDANYIAKLPLDSQILSYAVSCKKEKAIGKYPDFIVYNVCKKSQIRLKQTENMKQFSERLRMEYTENPTNYFYREILSFSKLDLEAYEADLEKFAVEMARAIKEHYYYRNYACCTQYGPCPYMALCLAKTNSAFDESMMSYRVKEDLHEELAA